MERRRHISNRNMDMMRERRISGYSSNTTIISIQFKKKYILDIILEAGMSDMTNATLGGMSTASSSFMTGSVPVVDLAELAEATNNWDIR